MNIYHGTLLELNNLPSLAIIVRKSDLSLSVVTFLASVLVEQVCLCPCNSFVGSLMLLFLVAPLF